MRKAVISLIIFATATCGCFLNSKSSVPWGLIAHQLRPGSSGGTGGSGSTDIPQIFEEFNFQWNGSYSPDSLWRRASWVGTGQNMFTLDNAVVESSYSGATEGVLKLTVTAGKLEGGEIQSVGDGGSNFSYGYYEVRMKVAKESGAAGCCVSFFWIQAPGYGPGEIDIEFLTNEAWTATSGAVHYSVHPAHTSVKRNLPFNPSSDFHRYGFLWTPTQVIYTVDGVAVYTFNSGVPASAPGYIMANAWTGAPTWGGGPPSQNATSVYDWIKYYPNVTEIPNE